MSKLSFEIFKQYAEATKTFILSKFNKNDVIAALGYTPVDSSQKGTAGGVAELDENGKVLYSQLPSYVDDVLEYSNKESFPASGESGKIYVDTTTNKSYRWGGSVYVELSGGVALGETSATAYRGDRGKIAYDHSQVTSGNPHGTSLSDLGITATAEEINRMSGVTENVQEQISNHSHDASGIAYSYSDSEFDTVFSSVEEALTGLLTGADESGNYAQAMFAGEAERTVSDENGNIIHETYATKSELTASQADWSINDESNSAYVKNKPCYKTVEETNSVLTEITGFDFVEEWDEGVWDNFSYLSAPISLVVGNTYIVNLNGAQYECVCTERGYLGEETIMDLEEPEQYPFYIYCSTIYESAEEGYSDGYCVGVYCLIKSPTIFSITEKYANSYKPIDKNFMPHFNLANYSERFNDYDNNEATGDYSHAEGSNTKATGRSSHAEGSNTKATGRSSHAEGSSTYATGDYSHAEGSGTYANGHVSHAEGSSTYANGYVSHAEGHNTHANGNYSHSEGYFSKAHGDYSHAKGYDTTADNYASISGGKFNKTMTTGGAYSNTVGDVLVLGNGAGYSKRSNAFRVTYAGASYGLSAFNSSGADYAEFFEWKDGNVDAEDRVGYFVTLDGDKIVKANSSDDYILGIISGQPCIVGNSDEDWLGRWEHDEFGRFIKVETEDPVIEHKIVEKQVPKTDEAGNPILNENGRPVMIITTVEEEVETGEVIKGWAYKENPNYDNTQKYVERRDRIEWDYVGMLGVLSVRDNGECVVNGFCKCGDGGIAIPATKGYDTYRVIERVSDNVIKVVFK